VDELDGRRGAQDALAVLLPGGEEHEQRAQALAAGGDRGAGVGGELRAVSGGQLGEALLDARQEAGDVVAGGADHLGDRTGPARDGAVGGHAFVPTWMAMMPPAVRIQRMSRRPARSIAAASPSGAGKRRTELGR
jgi:hypothetical protein